MTEKSFEYFKPEDWADFLTAYPEAYHFLRDRALYREYLALRLQLHAATDADQRKLIEYRLDEVEAEIISWPYRKPQPQPPMSRLRDTPTPPSMEFTSLSRGATFFADLSEMEQKLILEAARERFSLTGSEPDIYGKLHFFLWDAPAPPNSPPTEPPPGKYDSYELFYQTGGHVGPFSDWAEAVDAAKIRITPSNTYMHIFARTPLRDWPLVGKVSGNGRVEYHPE